MHHVAQHSKGGLLGQFPMRADTVGIYKIANVISQTFGQTGKRRKADIVGKILLDSVKTWSRQARGSGERFLGKVQLSSPTAQGRRYVSKRLGGIIGSGSLHCGRRIADPLAFS
ncbi:hypothetical protein B0G80_5921 [Paraburkholderia sp. BL6669N2]|nr:hypothetical protein B0G80_5921 [Paraburkholderia sp. BL6669N2]